MSAPYRIQRENCLWEKLARESRPIVLYGTGNGADKIIDALEQYEKRPDGVFASDGFVRSRIFRGMPVLSYAQAKKEFGLDMVILTAFGSSLPEIIEKFRQLDSLHTLYVPELPLFGSHLFNYDYYLSHKDEIEEAYELFQDEYSQALFRDMLDYRLRGELRFLGRTEPFAQSVRTLLNTSAVRTVLDGGAFNGDSASVFLQTCPNITKIIAAEPDERTFRKLTACAESSGTVLQPVCCALWDVCGTETFSASGNRGSSRDGKSRRSKAVEVLTRTVDFLSNGDTLDILKLDVEGAEARALAGADQTIRDSQPALLVSLYHRSEDLFALPLYIAHRYPRYSLYLRRVPCYPAWDLMLYAVPDRLAVRPTKK